MPGGTTYFLGVASDDTMTRRWLARASFALMLAAVALVLAVAGWHSLALIAFAAIGVCAVLAGGYWFLAQPRSAAVDRAGLGGRRAGAHPGRVRAPQPAVVAIVAVALMIAAAGTARAALSTGGPDAAMRPARRRARGGRS